jgi:hypothetical protein
MNFCENIQHSGIGNDKIMFGKLESITTITIPIKFQFNKYLIFIPSRLPLQSDKDKRKIREEKFIIVLTYWQQLNDAIVVIVCLKEQLDEYKKICAPFKNVIIIPYTCEIINRDYNVGDARNACLLIARKLNVKKLIMADDDSTLTCSTKSWKYDVNDVIVFMEKFLDSGQAIIAPVSDAKGRANSKKRVGNNEFVRNPNPGGLYFLNMTILNKYNFWFLPIRFLEDTVLCNQCSRVAFVDCLKRIRLNHLCETKFSTTRTPDSIDIKKYSHDEFTGMKTIIKQLVELKIIKMNAGKISINWIYDEDVKETNTLNYRGYEYLYQKDSIVATILNDIQEEKDKFKSNVQIQ